MHFGASAVGADGRRRDAGDAAAHLPGAATKQMPPRRRAPAGWGPQARWRCYSLLTYRSGYAQPAYLGTPAKCIGYFLTDPNLQLLPTTGVQNASEFPQEEAE